MHGTDSFLDLATLKNAGELRKIVFQNEKSGNRKCGVLKHESGISVDIISRIAVIKSKQWKDVCKKDAAVKKFEMTM